LHFSNAALGDSPAFLSRVCVIREVPAADVIRTFGLDDCPLDGLDFRRLGGGL